MSSRDHSSLSSPLDYSDLLPSFLQLVQTDEFGRGVYTRKSLSPGADVIVGCPLAHVISSHERESHCHWCVRKGGSLRKCGQCKFVWYCSRECQREDWLYHKAECKGISRISPSTPTDTVRLIVKLLVGKSNGIRTVSLLKGVEWDMDILTTHAPRYNEELKQSLGEQVFGSKLLMSDGKDFNAELAFQIACKMISNSFSILDWEMNSIGSGVYIIPALFNHSCSPNCIALFDGRKMKLRTIKQVPEGEQLFVSYTDLLETRERRQRHLQKYYLFSCTCERCSCDFVGSLDERLIQAAAELKESDKKLLYRDGFSRLDEAEKLKKRGDWISLESTVMQYLTDRTATLGDTNILIIKMRECLMDAYIEQQKWNEALKVAQTLREQYELYYATYTPFLGLHYFKMAKLLQQVSDKTNDLKESMALVDKAVGILSVTHGSAHHCVEEGKRLLYDTGMELASREKHVGSRCHALPNNWRDPVTV